MRSYSRDYHKNLRSYSRDFESAQPCLFYLFWIHPDKAQGLHPYLFQYRAFTWNVYRCFLFSATSPTWGSPSLISDWYARLGALWTFCNVSNPVYLWNEHTHQLVSPDTVCQCHTFHKLSILSVLWYWYIDINFQKYRIDIDFLKISTSQTAIRSKRPWDDNHS